MTRFIEYTRPHPRDEGSHGIVQPGQVLEVSEDQYHSAIASDSWRALACEEVAEPLNKEDFPQPAPTPFYNLPRLHWHKPRLKARLRRLPLRQIMLVAQAVEHITGQNVNYGPGAQRYDTVDEVITLAVTFGWTTPTRLVGGVAV